MKKVWIMLALAALLLLAVGAASAGSVSITDCSTDYAGHITLRWQGDSAPYSVRYCVKGYEDEGLWTQASDLYSPYLTMSDFAPDTTYVFYVVDSNNDYDTVTRTAYRKSFTGVSGMRLTVTLRQKLNGRASTINSYSARDLQSGLFNSQQNYGATIKFSYDRIGSSQVVFCRMVIVTPNGEPIVFVADNLELSARTGGSNYVYFDFFDFDTAWQIINSVYDTIPTGTYAFRLYMDEGFVGEKTFMVNR